jgi:hypothetical protein
VQLAPQYINASAICLCTAEPAGSATCVSDGASCLLLQVNGDNLDYVTSVSLTDGSASADAIIMWQGSTSLQVRGGARAVYMYLFIIYFIYFILVVHICPAKSQCR